MKEVRKRQRASNQLPALLKIKLVEAIGPGTAHRLSRRAQRHVNYTQPCRTIDIFTTDNKRTTCTTTSISTLNKETLATHTVVYLRREGRTPPDWRAGRDGRLRRVGACLLLSPLHVALDALRSLIRGITAIVMAYFGETPT